MIAILAFIAGGCFGVITMSCIVAASDADKRIETEYAQFVDGGR